MESFIKNNCAYSTVSADTLLVIPIDLVARDTMYVRTGSTLGYYWINKAANKLSIMVRNYVTIIAPSILFPSAIDGKENIIC